MESILFIALIVSFLATFLVLPFWIRKTKQIGLIWEDMNKLNSEKVAGSGGIAVVLGFTFGVLVYIAIKTFYFNSPENLVEIFALLIVILLVSGIGLVDDLFGWHHGGLSVKSRIIFVLLSAVPLMVINVGTPEIYVPFVGVVNIGIIYALFFIPIAILGTTTTFNFLAGHNGLEASQGILVLGALAIMSWINGTSWLSLIVLCMIASLIAFLYFNKYPAKVFPGDVLTYAVGAMIAIMAILGNYEIFAVFIFIPYIFEVVLKSRGRLKKASFGEPQSDGSIKNKYNKIYGLEHLAIRILEKIKTSKKAYEWEVVLLINAFQLAIIIFAFLIYIF